MCIYRTNDGQCIKYSNNGCISYCVDGPCPDEKLSNADRVRSMNDEELARFLVGVENRRNIYGRRTNCKDKFYVLEWLFKPAED